MLDEVQPVCGLAFLDCGAHSVHTGFWDKLPIDDYIKFVNQNHKRFRLIAAPDVVGNTQETLENFKYFIERVTIPREKILSVYHLQAREIHRFEEVLDYSQEANLSWVAIGGALGVGFTDVQKMVALEQVYKKLEERGNPFKVHLFGIPDPTTIKLFKPESVDSSTFIQKARVLELHEYDLEGWRFKMNQPFISRKFSRQRMSEEITNILLYHSPALLEFDGMADNYDYVFRNVEKASDAVKFIAVNLMNLVEFERYVNEKLDYSFTHYITCPTSYITGYTGYFKALFHFAWKNRSLVAYPQYWELSSPKLERELKLFGELK